MIPMPSEEELILSREIFDKVSGDVWDNDVPLVRKCLELARFILARESALKSIGERK